MREVERSRFVRATPSELEPHLTPRALVAAEGSFEVLDVAERDEATLVTAGARGLALTLRFERRGGGVYYAQEGEAGPFDAMETWVTVRRKNEGSILTVRSQVSLGLPLPALSDRLAAWKRGGELDRALDSIAAAVE
ncbi:MAG: SRPBCC family protein [Salinigranum sp.]